MSVKIMYESCVVACHYRGVWQAPTSISPVPSGSGWHLPRKAAQTMTTLVSSRWFFAESSLVAGLVGTATTHDSLRQRSRLSSEARAHTRLACAWSSSGRWVTPICEVPST